MDTSPRFEQASKRAFSLLDEFKAFAFKGNVVDLAVGVIIGAAFGKIVDSLVKNIIMPLVSLIPAFDSGYQSWAWTLGEGPDAKTVPYGLFLADVLNFLIVALALFVIVVKFLNGIMRFKQEQKDEAVPTLTKDQELLGEIRDLLKARP